MRAGFFENNAMDMSEATRILIVDDSEDDSLLISHQLQREIPNAAFRRVDTEEGMVCALHEHDWDLVISDHSMPRFSINLQRTRRQLAFLNCAASNEPVYTASGLASSGILRRSLGEA